MGRRPRKNLEDFAEAKSRDASPLPISDEWRQRVAVRLTEMGQTQKSLAKHIGASQPSVSQCLGGLREQDASALVSPISSALSIDLPLPAQVLILARKLESADLGRLEEIRDSMRMMLRIVDRLADPDDSDEHTIDE